MRATIKRGIGFGTTTGVITTLALMVGLDAGTGSRAAVIAGIVTIAFADGLSDALGMHISEESASRKLSGVWEAALATFLSKFFLALTFVVPVLVLGNLQTAIMVSVLWGLLLLSGLSHFIAQSHGEKSLQVIGEHVGIAILVLAITWGVGTLIGMWV